MLRGLQANREYCLWSLIRWRSCFLEKAGRMVGGPVSVLFFSFFHGCPGSTAVTLSLDKKFDCFQKEK